MLGKLGGGSGRPEQDWLDTLVLGSYIDIQILICVLGAARCAARLGPAWGRLGSVTHGSARPGSPQHYKEFGHRKPSRPLVGLRWTVYHLTYPIHCLTPFLHIKHRFLYPPSTQPIVQSDGGGEIRPPGRPLSCASARRNMSSPTPLINQVSRFRHGPATPQHYRGGVYPDGL